MTVETPPAGNPSLAGDGHPDHGAASPGVFSGPTRTEFGAQTPVDSGARACAEPLYPVDLAVLALRGMAVELRARGVEAREDGVSGVVDAGPAARPQSALLRPHRGDLWWWMRWPRQDGVPSALSGVPLSPVTRTSDAARRIVGALSASAEGG
ncbi:hypothetical protein [Nocardiopsis valliformis]|uniref:hypothetical protein n=1 Tax=Nocardiopsis valliformis TaxID=239974 RepID=UPI00034DD76B